MVGEVGNFIQSAQFIPHSHKYLILYWNTATAKWKTRQDGTGEHRYSSYWCAGSVTPH